MKIPTKAIATAGGKQKAMESLIEQIAAHGEDIDIMPVTDAARVAFTKDAIKGARRIQAFKS